MKRSDLLKEIGKLKLEGKFEEALVLGGKILSEDIYDPENYSLIGKIYYLLNDYDASSRYFLTALHMELLHAYKERENNEIYRKESDAIISSVETPLVKHLAKNDIRRLAILFGHTLIHIAHSMADGSIDSEKIEEVKEYRDILSGKSKETSDRYLKMEKEFYLALGLVFSLAVIDGKLGVKEAVVEYFKKDEHELVDIYMETLSLLKKIR